MSETDQYYSYYEKLMRMTPQTAIEERPEYRALATRYPYLSDSIRVQKKLERLDGELKSTKERAKRLQIRGEMRNLTNELKRLEILKRIHGESKLERRHKKRSALAAIPQKIQGTLEKLSRSRRLSMASRVPPSLLDLKSLDSMDRSLALKEWIKRRRRKVRRRKPASSVGAKTS